MRIRVAVGVPFVACMALASLLVGCGGGEGPAAMEIDQGAPFCAELVVMDDGSGHVPLSPFCADANPLRRRPYCDQDQGEFEAQFETCAQTELSFPHRCWNRYAGCGVVAYARTTDESASDLVVYNDDGSLRGTVLSSDTSLPVCDTMVSRLLVGEPWREVLPGPRRVCESVELTYCCPPD